MTSKNDLKNMVNEVIDDPTNEFEGDCDAIKFASVAQTMMLKSLEMKYGLDWKNDPNFTETPHRVAKSVVNDMCKGINSEEEIKSLLTTKIFPTNHEDLVVSGPVEFYGLCPHHFFPVRYNCWFGYKPVDYAIGLSKISRTIKLFGSQPILQEDFTSKYVDLFDQYVPNSGCMLLVKGQHGCMTCRGAEVGQNYWVTSIKYTKEFTDINYRSEFFNIIGKSV